MMKRPLQIWVAVLTLSSVAPTMSWATSSSNTAEQVRKLKQQYQDNQENITHAGDYKSSSSTADMPVLYRSDIKKDDAATVAPKTR